MVLARNCLNCTYSLVSRAFLEKLNEILLIGLANFLLLYCLAHCFLSNSKASELVYQMKASQLLTMIVTASCKISTTIK